MSTEKDLFISEEGGTLPIEADILREAIGQVGNRQTQAEPQVS